MWVEGGDAVTGHTVRKGHRQTDGKRKTRRENGREC